MAAKPSRATPDPTKQQAFNDLVAGAIMGSIRLHRDARRKYAMTVDESRLRKAFATYPTLGPDMARGDFNFRLEFPPNVSKEAAELAAHAIKATMMKTAAALLDPAVMAKEFPKKKPKSGPRNRLRNAALRDALMDTGRTRQTVQKALRAVVDGVDEPPSSFSVSRNVDRPPRKREKDVLLALLDAERPLLLPDLARQIFLRTGRIADQKAITSQIVPAMKKRGWISNSPRRGYILTGLGKQMAKEFA